MRGVPCERKATRHCSGQEKRREATMTTPARDHWAEWVLQRRFGGDPHHRQAMLETLSGWRDQILLHANVAEGETLLDVGCGDGLIAFGALDRVGAHGTVIFSDVSQDLLDHCRTLAHQLHVLDRCRFVRASGCPTPKPSRRRFGRPSTAAPRIRSLACSNPRRVTGRPRLRSWQPRSICPRRRSTSPLRRWLHFGARWHWPHNSDSRTPPSGVAPMPSERGPNSSHPKDRRYSAASPVQSCHTS